MSQRHVAALQRIAANVPTTTPLTEAMFSDLLLVVSACVEAKDPPEGSVINPPQKRSPPQVGQA